LPLDVISELIGIPDEQRRRVHELSELVAARDGTNSAPDAAYLAATELAEFLTSLVRERRRNPGSDVMSLLINTRVVDDDGNERALEDDEVTKRSPS
jgi:cytochrome P450